MTTVVSRRKPKPLGKFSSSVERDLPLPLVSFATKPDSARPADPVCPNATSSLPVTFFMKGWTSAGNNTMYKPWITEPTTMICHVLKPGTAPRMIAIIAAM